MNAAQMIEPEPKKNRSRLGRGCFADQGPEFVERDRVAEIEALGEVATALAQQTQLRHVLDTLGDRVPPDVLSVACADPALLLLLGAARRAPGLDLFENEPDIAAAYRMLSNVFALPHIGSSTLETRVAMARLLIDGMEASLAGGAVGNRLA